jgi:EAL domain-containing protein (putative c-di-GMP-specific phosphodiesterase class I)
LEDVAAALQASGLDPSSLQLEITESVLLDDVEGALTTLHRLRGLGVRLALDDFGTGYSSLSHLKRLPVDVIKIDKSFAKELGADPKNTLIVQSMVNLGRVLGMQVAGEGIETAEQYAHACAIGFTLAQGHYFARPQPAVQAEVTIRRLAAKAGGTQELKARSFQVAAGTRWPAWH